MKITINKFPTHIAKTDNKIAQNKYIKINNQSIYNSNLNRFARNIVMKNLHNYLVDIFKPFKSLFHKEKKEYPINICLDIYTVKNHGSISRRKNKIIWKTPKLDYIPNWDIENLSAIWMKAINDSLVKAGFFPDDNIDYVFDIRSRYFEVKDIEDRKLIISINEKE